jgi:hypothetical protein
VFHPFFGFGAGLIGGIFITGFGLLALNRLSAGVPLLGLPPMARSPFVLGGLSGLNDE